ncbi:unnamed protein product, partial [Amoebophrya sp. A25]
PNPTPAAAQPAYHSRKFGATAAYWEPHAAPPTVRGLVFGPGAPSRSAVRPPSPGFCPKTILPYRLLENRGDRLRSRGPRARAPQACQPVRGK